MVQARVLRSREKPMDRTEEEAAWILLDMTRVLPQALEESPPSPEVFPPLAIPPLAILSLICSQNTQSSPTLSMSPSPAPGDERSKKCIKQETVARSVARRKFQHCVCDPGTNGLLDAFKFPWEYRWRHAAMMRVSAPHGSPFETQVLEFRYDKVLVCEYEVDELTCGNNEKARKLFFVHYEGGKWILESCWKGVVIAGQRVKPGNRIDITSGTEISIVGLRALMKDDKYVFTVPSTLAPPKHVEPPQKYEAYRIDE